MKVLHDSHFLSLDNCSTVLVFWAPLYSDNKPSTQALLHKRAVVHTIVGFIWEASISISSGMKSSTNYTLSRKMGKEDERVWRNERYYLNAFQLNHFDWHKLAWTFKNLLHVLLGFIGEKLVSGLLDHFFTYLADAVIIFWDALPFPNCLDAVLCCTAWFSIGNTLAPITWAFRTLINWCWQVTSRDHDHTSSTRQ